MRNIATYILVIIAILCSGCTKDEFNRTPEKVDFAVRYTSFNVLDVASTGTKAQPNPAELTDDEKRIVSAYFLVFNGTADDADDAELIEFRTITPSNNTIPSQSVYNLNGENGQFTVCYLANVTEEFAKSIQTISNLKSKPYSVTYADFDATNHIWGIPQLNGTKCFPMFGMATYEGGEASVVVPLERLFAKVYINLAMELPEGEDWADRIASGLTPPYFKLDEYGIYDLPNQVVLKGMVGSSGNVLDSYVKDNSNKAWYEYTSARQNNEIELGTSVLITNPGYIDELDGLLGTSLSGNITNFEFTLYVPEYAVESGNPDATNALEKPNLKVVGTYPVHMKFKGVIHQLDYEDAEFNYTIYLGHNATNSFSFCRNTQYNNILTIKGVNNAILGSDKRVEYKGYNLADPTNSGEYDPANCYIISKPGRYILPTFRGNTSEILKGKVDANSIIHINGATTNTITNISVSTDATGKDCIIFDVNMSVDNNQIKPSDVKGANKLLALKDESGNNIWSWHLWFCEDGKRPDIYSLLEKYPTSDGRFNGCYVMNRPLGAIDSDGIDLTFIQMGQYLLWKDGLFYQWGRKDPIAVVNDENKQTGASWENSILNPQIFYLDWKGNDEGCGWAQSKSKNDPCPPGYKVPSSSVWRGTNPDEDKSILTYKLTNAERYTYNTSQSNTDDAPSMLIFYSYPGYYDDAGEPVSSKKVEKSISTEKDKVISNYGIPEKREVPSLPLGNLVTPKQFRNITFKFNHVVSTGACWANDKLSLLYGYSEFNTGNEGILGSLLASYEISSCEYQTGTVNYYTERRQTGTFLGRPIYTTYYIYDGTVNWNNNWKQLNSTDISSTNFLTERTQLKTDLDNYLKQLTLSEGAYLYNNDVNFSTTHGLNVRCVLDK